MVPNWCSNVATFRHRDASMIRRVIGAINDGRLMQEFDPCPQDLMETTSGNFADIDSQSHLEFREKVNLELYGYANWYDWCVSEWGTKWDVGDPSSVEHISEDGLESVLCFDTAWSPPIAFYETMESLGFEVTAMYYEPGMGFCGMFEDGVDSCYSIPNDSKKIEDEIPIDINERFSISENLENWQDESIDE